MAEASFAVLRAIWTDALSIHVAVVDDDLILSIVTWADNIDSETVMIVDQSHVGKYCLSGDLETIDSGYAEFIGTKV